MKSPEHKMHFFPYRDKDGKVIAEDKVGVTLRVGMNEVTEEQYKWLSVHPDRNANYGLTIGRLAESGLLHQS